MDHPNGATMEATSARLLHYDAGKLIAEICLSFTEEKASKKKKKKEKKKGKKIEHKNSCCLFFIWFLCIKLLHHLKE